MDGYGESDGSDDGFKDSPSDSGKEVDGCSDTADTDGFNEGGRDGSGVIEVDGCSGWDTGVDGYNDGNCDVDGFADSLNDGDMEVEDVTGEG